MFNTTEKLLRKTNKMRIKMGLSEILTDGKGNFVNQRKSGKFTKLKRNESYIDKY